MFSASTTCCTSPSGNCMTPIAGGATAGSLGSGGGGGGFSGAGAVEQAAKARANRSTSRWWEFMVTCLVRA
jgi:hypothetical protein